MPLDPFVQAVVRASSEHQNWRERLQWVASQFTDSAFDPTPEHLATLAIYLRFLATGEVKCEDNGGHFRPNHLAAASLRIAEALPLLVTPSRAWIMRRIYPYLPSFGEEFQRAEPLTRIRDIAHRNDIPGELKNEIKNRLQNKLHRCAGPEDLTTSADILARITAKRAGLSDSFVQEFKIFHEELREFFNASALETRLEALEKTLSPPDKRQVRTFLELKKNLSDTLPELLNLLEMLTALRKRLETLGQVLAGKKDVQHLRASTRLRMIDIELSDYAFVLLSKCIQLLGKGPDIWSALLRALAVALENVRLDLIEPEECAVLLSELAAWTKAGFQPERFCLLRLKATLDRTRRLAGSYTDQIMALFPPRVEELGRALGVCEQSIRTFCEGDIRGSLVFQLSKLAETGLREARGALALSPWETLVSGSAVGALLRARTLKDLPAVSGPVLVLLEEAQGDEEIPANVKGIAVAHPLPHLSHLGVRARQAQVIFAACDERAVFDAAASFVGRQVRFSANPEGLLVSEATGNAALPVMQHLGVSVPKAVLAKELVLLPLNRTEMATSGAKAFGARRLQEKAAQPPVRFNVPRGMVVPFGIMEICLRKDKQLEHRYLELQARVCKESSGDLEAVLVQLRDCVNAIAVAPAIVDKLTTFFGPNTPLAVRSSSNAEDLETMAGAGLYDSVLNVSAATAANAIKRVWASLWTRRATLSRIQAGIPHNQVYMAVLLQELVAPELSFIMHTAHPLTGSLNEAYAEVAVGLGEILASASEAGSPWRLVCHRDTGAVKLETCASFSIALRPQTPAGVVRERLDYSKVALSTDPATAEVLGRRLSGIADALEKSFGRPQDVEGVLAGQNVYVVQSRPQQGLSGLVGNQLRNQAVASENLFSGGHKPAFSNGLLGSKTLGVAMTTPKYLAILSKQDIDGDDALYKLAQTRFEEAGLGGEFYPETPDILQQQLAFSPRGQPCTAHLPRSLNLLQGEARERVADFAGRSAGHLYGLVVHDHAQFDEEPKRAVEALRDLARHLARVPNAPLVFVEYASGLAPELFAHLFEETRDVEQVSACIDAAHVGIRVCQTAFAANFGPPDICSIKADSPALPEKIDAIQRTVATALPAVLDLIQRLARLRKPLHFHLHDGHPLSGLSRYGVCDHLSFDQELRLPIAYQGRRLIGGMFGPGGLRQIVQTALAQLPANSLSFMLEVHPQEGRAPLGPWRGLFSHWRDTTNAERMNYWLDMLLRNATLLRDACASAKVATKAS
jgi:phosphoglucan,water dikinase